MSLKHKKAMGMAHTGFMRLWILPCGKMENLTQIPPHPPRYHPDSAAVVVVKCFLVCYVGILMTHIITYVVITVHALVSYVFMCTYLKLKAFFH